MLLSKGLAAFRTLNYINSPRNLQCIRNSHTWNYRTGPKPASKNIYLAAELVQGFAWWWVLWHLYTEPGHIIGEFPYPDPREWTDEELGIPPIE